MARQGAVIVDRGALQALVEAALARRYPGQHLKAAARRVGIERATLWRILHRQAKRLSLTVELKLERLLAPPPVGTPVWRRQQRAFADTLYPDAAHELVTRYEHELHVAAGRFAPIAEHELEELLWRARRILGGDPFGPVMLETPTFSGRIERYGQARARLAWLRVLGPLLELHRLGGLERPWQDYPASAWKKGGALHEFITKGAAREQLLLRDHQPLQRARDIVTHRRPSRQETL